MNHNQLFSKRSRIDFVSKRPIHKNDSDSDADDDDDDDDTGVINIRIPETLNSPDTPPPIVSPFDMTKSQQFNFGVDFGKFKLQDKFFESKPENVTIEAKTVDSTPQKVIIEPKAEKEAQNVTIEAKKVDSAPQKVIIEPKPQRETPNIIIEPKIEQTSKSEKSVVGTKSEHIQKSDADNELIIDDLPKNKHEDESESDIDSDSDGDDSIDDGTGFSTMEKNVLLHLTDDDIFTLTSYDDDIKTKLKRGVKIYNRAFKEVINCSVMFPTDASREYIRECEHHMKLSNIEDIDEWIVSLTVIPTSIMKYMIDEVFETRQQSINICKAITYTATAWLSGIIMGVLYMQQTNPGYVEHCLFHT